MDNVRVRKPLKFIKMRFVHEPDPGPKWQKVFEKAWPYYKNWFLSEGYGARPGYLTSFRAFRDHFPELVPTYNKLVKLGGDGDLEARYLTQYCPPAYMSGCSQIAWTREAPTLIRNYDYSPELFEGLVLYTDWCQPVMGVVDCSWGLLDGINGSGLSISLTFGGRKLVGKGFGIPLLVRYMLEVCTTVQEAVEVAKSIPVHMAYNLTFLDASGDFMTAYLSPDREPVFERSPVGTNHQLTVEWEDYAALTATMERRRLLENAWFNPTVSKEKVIKMFLNPPLFNTKYEKAFGTLYTSAYNTLTRSVELIWPEKRITQTFDNFQEGKVMVKLHPFVSTKFAM